MGGGLEPVQRISHPVPAAVGGEGAEGRGAVPGLRSSMRIVLIPSRVRSRSKRDAPGNRPQKSMRARSHPHISTLQLIMYPPGPLLQRTGDSELKACSPDSVVHGEVQGIRPCALLGDLTIKKSTSR